MHHICHLMHTRMEEVTLMTPFNKFPDEEHFFFQNCDTSCPHKHNQDEIPQFTKFAEEIGARYRRVPAFEFVDKDSYEVNSHGKTYTLEKNTLIERNKPFRLEKGKQKPQDYCIITSGTKTIIVHALGVVYPCCHIEGEFFQFYSDYFAHGDPKPKDRQHNPRIYDDFIQKIETQGGIKTISLEYNTLEEIMNTK